MCFDVDGTLSIGDPRGVIPVEALWHLATLDVVTCIVSDSHGKVPYWVKQKVRFVSGTAGGRKAQVLARILGEARRAYHYVIPFYIGDTEFDRIEAVRAGYIYMHPREFKLYWQSGLGAVAYSFIDSMDRSVMTRFGGHRLLYVDDVLAEIRRARGNVLDVGCGDCYMAHYIGKSKYYGVDIARSGCWVGERSGCVLDEPGFYNCYFEVVESNTSYDLVLFIESLEHMYDYVQVLEKVYRWLNDGGRVVVQTANPYMLETMIDGTHYHVINPILLKRLMERIGYRVVKLKDSGTSSLIIGEMV